MIHFYVKLALNKLMLKVHDTYDDNFSRLAFKLSELPVCVTDVWTTRTDRTWTGEQQQHTHEHIYLYIYIYIYIYIYKAAKCVTIYIYIYM